MGNEFDKNKYLNENNQQSINLTKSLVLNNNIGCKLDDFKFIEFLDNKNYDQYDTEWSVAKVISLKNKKIYAMKKIELYNIKNILSRKEIFEEIKQLYKLNNPYIIKYYASFRDHDDNLYLIMEYMNNGNLDDFINAQRIYNLDIKEDDIWNILFQCSCALKYLEGKNLNNYGIKLNNIFMNNEQNVKIDIFNEIKNNQDKNSNFNDNIDILGKYFYPILFSSENKNKYSDELKNIIQSMTNKEPNEKLNSEDLYNMVKNIYNEKYPNNNTSIKAVLRCLYSYPNFKLNDFNDIMLINRNQSREETNLNIYFEFIRIMLGFGNRDLNKCIEKFRFLVISDNLNIIRNKEIDPFYFLIYVLEKMNKEINISNQNERNEEENNLLNSSIDSGDIDKMLAKFNNDNKKYQNNPIFDSFVGSIVTELKCQRCETSSYSFKNLYFVLYDLTKHNSKNFDLINDGFNFDKTHFIEKDYYCNFCLSEQKHYEYNKYNKIGRQLVIYFYRGNAYKNNTNIKFNENINLIEFVENKNESNKYYLIGSINRIEKNGKEEFIYFVRDCNNFSIWYNNDDEIISKDNSPINDIGNTGQIILLFYNKKD